MLDKSPKWELSFVHFIKKFTISRFAISRFECRKKKVGQSIEHFLRFSWLSMQFQIAKVFPASLHFSVGKKNFWVFFLFARRETQHFPWLLSRPCSNTSNNIAERSMIWSKLISKHFFPTYSSLFRCWHIISLHLYIFLIMQDEQEHSALYYFHYISLQKELNSCYR